MTGSSVTIREPEYNDRDRALLFAAWSADSEPRNSYGIPISDATDPNLKSEWEAKSRRDFSALAVNRNRKEYEKLYPHDDLDSLMWRVQRKPDSGAEDF